MSPPFRKIHSFKEAILLNAAESAVMILLYERNNKTFLTLIERTIYKGKHSGEISLPGGKKNINDFSLEHTAKRETVEEIGVDFSKIEILTQLSHLYIPISNFLVFPFIGVYSETPSFIKQEKEVQNIIEVDLDDLLDYKNIDTKLIYLKDTNVQFDTPIYKLNNIHVWGATAMILCEFIFLLNSFTFKE